MNEQERKEFERWYEGHCLPGEADWFRRDPDEPDEYKHGHTSEAWAGWQARAALAAKVPADARKLIEQCRDALAEELGAWDIDPPLFHVKEAHDACVAWLAAAPACTCPSGDGSLRWPCPEHPAPEAEFIDGDCVIGWVSQPRQAPAQAQQAAEPPNSYERELLEAFPGFGDMRGMEIWVAQVRHYLRAKAKPEAQQPKGLTTERLRQMHHEDEFGLFCDFDDFEQIARAVEQEHGIGASGEASNG